MKAGRIVILFLITALCFKAYAQKLSLSGYLLDGESGEALVGANIYDLSSNTGTVSNKFGYYTLFLSRNTNYTLQVSFVGFKTSTLHINLSNDTLVNIRLQPDNISLNEVVIQSQGEERLEDRAEIGKVSIPMSEIKLMPTITGEPDILKAYQLVPGIQGGQEGNNGLFVRGGTPDQNLFLLDDVPLYNVSHLGGFFSVFDPSMVKSIDLYKGGFPARYGGRISSVVDIRNKEGNLYSYNGEVGFSLFMTKFFIEGPIKKEKSSFAFSVRRCNLDLLTNLYYWLSTSDHYTGYTFYDINFKMNMKLSETDRLFFSVYNGRDNFFYRDKKETDVAQLGIEYAGNARLIWGNSSASLRWLHILDKTVFNNLTLAFTRYSYNNKNSFTRTETNTDTKFTDEYGILSRINNMVLKDDAEVPLEYFNIRFGAVFNYYNFIPSYVSYDQRITVSGEETILLAPEKAITASSSDFFGYAELNFDWGDKISANIGLRAGSYFANSTAFPSIQPRVIVNYTFLPSFSFKASYCTMQQNMHLLTNSNTGMPTDVWVPSTAQLAPETSKQFSIGLAHTTKQAIEFSIEAYIKKVNNLIEYKEGVLIYSSAQNWEDKVEKGGTGNMKGVEFLINKSKGRLSGWVGYTLASNQRTFVNINNGEDFPFKYEQRHNFSIVAIYKLNEKFSLSGTWVYNSGNRITLPAGKYQLYDYNYIDPSHENDNIFSDVHIYSEKNGYKMADYHRLDIGVNYTKPVKRGISNWFFSIYNVYNRQNAYYLFFSKTKTGEVKLYQQSLFPIMVNFGYSFSF